MAGSRWRTFVSAKSFYLLTSEVYSGSAGSVFRWAMPDLAELCWALDATASLMQGSGYFHENGKSGTAELTLFTVNAGRVAHSTGMGESAVHDEAAGVDHFIWDEFNVPRLYGEPLPPGHIAAVAGHAYPLRYGFSVHHDI